METEIKAGDILHIELRSITFEKDGETFVFEDAGKKVQIIVADEHECQHAETLCPACVDSWSSDWHIFDAEHTPLFDS